MGGLAPSGDKKAKSKEIEKLDSLALLDNLNDLIKKNEADSSIDSSGFTWSVLENPPFEERDFYKWSQGEPIVTPANMNCQEGLVCYLNSRSKEPFKTEERMARMKGKNYEFINHEFQDYLGIKKPDESIKNIDGTGFESVTSENWDEAKDTLLELPENTILSWGHPDGRVHTSIVRPGNKLRSLGINPGAPDYEGEMTKEYQKEHTKYGKYPIEEVYKDHIGATTDEYIESLNQQGVPHTQKRVFINKKFVGLNK